MNLALTSPNFSEKSDDLREERYRLLFADNPLPMWLFDAETLTFLQVNKAAIEKYGYSRDEFLQMTILDIRPQEDVERLKVGLKTHNGLQSVGEWRHRLKDERIIDVEVTSHVTEWDGRGVVFGTAQDITARKQAESALKLEREFLRKVIDTSPSLIFVKDWDGKFSLTNKTLADIYGTTPEELVGKGDADFNSNLEEVEIFLADDREVMRTLREKLIAQEQVTDARTGQAQWWQTIKVPLRSPDGTVSQVLGVSTDITERIRAEEKIQRQLAQMTALRDIDIAITSSLDLNLTLNIILEKVAQLLVVDATDVLLLDANTQVLEHAAGYGFRSPLDAQRARLRLGEGMAGKVALERRTLNVPDLREYRDLFVRKPLAAIEGFAAYFGVPLIAKGKVIGVLETFHRSPLDPDQDWLSFLNALAGQAAIAIDSATTFDSLQRSNAELALAYDTTLEGWSAALDLRDKETEGHTQRVTELTVQLARAMGFSPQELVQIRRGALLHDIGKMGIPDQILLKPDKLTDEEWEIMRKHPTYAYELLKPIAYLRPALEIPYSHHEKWDGSGYPLGLKGEQIPLAARIFAVADVYDALTSDRPYRAGWPKEKVLEYIRSLAGIHFDPQVVQIFLNEINRSSR
jgi:PAS domain S-box-containing protein/putative nucleotidyltransferase with HDIG domain